MRSTRALLLGALLCALAVAACGPSDGASDGRDPEAASTPEPPAVASISVVQMDGQGAGTVWTLDRRFDGDRAGADAAFDAAGRPALRARTGGEEQRPGPRQVPSFRVVVVWEDGERTESVGGPAMLGPAMTAVVVATRKAAEPVRG